MWLKATIASRVEPLNCSSRPKEPRPLLLPHTLNTVLDSRRWSGEKMVDGIVFQTANSSVPPTSDHELEALYNLNLATAPSRLQPPAATKWK
jgi:hypothetical protein